ncbi:hypothetical protein EUX98_g9522, partial [Antrodiella citrinella]
MVLQTKRSARPSSQTVFASSSKPVNKRLNSGKSPKKRFHHLSDRATNKRRRIQSMVQSSPGPARAGGCSNDIGSDSDLRDEQRSEDEDVPGQGHQSSEEPPESDGDSELKREFKELMWAIDVGEDN